MRRLINELDIGSLPYLAFTNLMLDTVADYHLFWGVKTRTLVQQLMYAANDLPGQAIPLARAKSDLTARLERDNVMVASKTVLLQYILPLDDHHWEQNPPMRRIEPKSLESKSTQTEDFVGMLSN